MKRRKVVKKSLTQGLNQAGGSVSQGLNAQSGAPAAIDTQFYVYAGEQAIGPHPTFTTHKLRAMAASGMGETLSMQAELERMGRTEEEDPRVSPTPHVVNAADVTRGLGLDSADEQRVQRLVTEYASSGTPQRLGPQRTSLQTRSRLLESMRTGMRHVAPDTRDQVMRRAQALWTREAAQVAATGPLRGGIRYHLDTTEKSMDGADVMFVIPLDVLSKGVARGGKYYRRVPTGKADRPWRYYYTRQEYEKDHGASAHLHGPEIEERRTVSGQSAEHYAREADKHHEKAAKAKDAATRDYHEERAARFEDLADKHSQAEQMGLFDAAAPAAPVAPAIPAPVGPAEIKSKGGVYLATRDVNGQYEILTQQFNKDIGRKTWEPARNAFQGNSLEVTVEMARRERLMGKTPEESPAPEPVVETAAPSGASAHDIITTWKAPEGVTMTRRDLDDGSGGFTVTLRIPRGTKKAWADAHAAGKALRDAIRASGDQSFVWSKKLETNFTDWFQNTQFGDRHAGAAESSFRFYPAESQHAREVKDPTVKAAREAAQAAAEAVERQARDEKNARTSVVEAIAQHAELVSRGRDVAAMREALQQIEGAPRDTYRDFLMTSRAQQLHERIRKVEADRGHDKALPEHLAAGYELGKRAVAEGVPSYASLEHARTLLNKFDGGEYGGAKGAVQEEWRRGHADAVAAKVEAAINSGDAGEMEATRRDLERLGGMGMAHASALDSAITDAKEAKRTRDAAEKAKHAEEERARRAAEPTVFSVDEVAGMVNPIPVIPLPSEPRSPFNQPPEGGWTDEHRVPLDQQAGHSTTISIDNPPPGGWTERDKIRQPSEEEKAATRARMHAARDAMQAARDRNVRFVFEEGQTITIDGKRWRVHTVGPQIGNFGVRHVLEPVGGSSARRSKLLRIWPNGQAALMSATTGAQEEVKSIEGPRVADAPVVTLDAKVGLDPAPARAPRQKGVADPGHLADAERMGRESFAAGRPSAPALAGAGLDALRLLYPHDIKAQMAIMGQYVRGWNAANIAAPVPEADAPSPTPAPPPPPPPETPRAEAKKATKAAEESGEYVNDRASKIEQRGEDVLGSARHKAAVWKSLREALDSNDAPEMFTRDFLSRQEPAELISRLQQDDSPSVAMAGVMAHLALRRFPPAPAITRLRPGMYYDGDSRLVSGYQASVSRGSGTTGEMPSQAEHEKMQRAAYYDAWTRAKRIAELGTFNGSDRDTIAKGFRALYDEMKAKHGDQSAAPDAIRLVYNALTARGSTSVQGMAGDFAKRIREKYGSLEAGVHHVSEHAKLLLEGKSMNAAFGTKAADKEPDVDLSTVYDTDKMVRRGPASDYHGVKQALDELDKSTGGKYAMRGVQWGKSVTDAEREHHLKSLLDSCADLTDALGLPASMASFNGRLAIAIGARGRAGALAHYEPDQMAINLSRAGGAGSLAHEWAHFFDNVVARVEHGSSKGYATQYTPKGDPLTTAIAEWRNAPALVAFRNRVNEATRTMGLSSKKRQYWGSTIEVWARAFERHMQRKLEKQGRENTYLVALSKAMPGTDPGSGVHLWPTDEEADAIAPYFDAVFKAFRESPTLHKALRMMGVPLIAPQFRHLVDRLEIEIPA